MLPSGMIRVFGLLLGLACTFAAPSMLPAQPQGGGNVPEVIRKGRELTRSGDLEGALALYRGELQSNPKSVPALNGAGVVLDLLGRTEEARVHFQKLIDLAASNPQKVSAYRAMAMSYAFDGNCLKTKEYEELALEVHVADGDAYNQGERANEAARVCIEAGMFDEAEALYRRGTELGLKEAGIKPERVALWNFRLEHALARLAARRNQAQQAQVHLAKAKQILDGNPAMAKDQMPFFPYLTGYVALWTGKYDLAIAELAKANQNDPFIQCLIAQAHEMKGDKAAARAWFEKAAKTTNHNPPAAYARPFASAKLKSL